MPPENVDKFKYNQFQQTSHCPRPLEKRGPLKLPKIFEKFNLNKKQIQTIKLKAASRAASTQSVHNRHLTLFEKFCNKKGYNILNFSEKVLKDYIIYLDESNAKFSQVSGFSGAIQFLCASTRKHDYWTTSIDRLFEATLRRAASKKGLTKKKLYNKFILLIKIISF